MIFGFLFAEILSWYVVVEAFGFLRAIAAYFIIAFVGIIFLQTQGFRTVMDLARHQSVPVTLLTTATRIGAAILMIVPGFFSSCLAVLLLIPLTRDLIIKSLKQKFRGRFTVVNGFPTQPPPRDVTGSTQQLE